MTSIQSVSTRRGAAGASSRVLALALAATLTLSVAAPAFAAGAIAVDDDAGGTAEDAGYGTATGYGSREEAAEAAMKKCREYGNKNCKVVVRFDVCGAYASSRRKYGVGWGDTEEEAKRIALQQCGNDGCRVAASDCE